MNIRLMIMMTGSSYSRLVMFVYLLLFATPLPVSAQPDEHDILRAAQKISGVYRTFKEFRTNSPSIVGQFKMTQRKIKLMNNQTGKYEAIEDSVWGACLNDTVYFFQKKLELRTSPHFYKLKFLGRYCFFEDQGSFKNGGFGANAIVYPYEYEFVLNINNGKPYKLNKKIMRTILAKDQELLAEFEDESLKAWSFEKYIRKFNERNPQDIKPVSEIIE